MNLADQLLEKGIRGAVKRGCLRVMTPTHTFEAGDGTGEPVMLRFLDAKAQWGFITDPDVRMGELFMDGRITTEPGKIYDVILLLLQDYRNRKEPAYLRAIDRLRARFGRLAQRNTIARAQSNVAHHYDLSVDLYRLFLDREMQYSCAYFETPDADIDTAQAAKQRHIAAKLMLEPGQRVLDIGCGWGGLAAFIGRTGKPASVLGISLSQEQIAYARTRAAALRAAPNVTYELEDYRKLSGTFDRIVSVGMFEHVGQRHYDAFFKTCADRLARDGVMLLHTIGSSDGPGYVTPWVTKYIFPGGSIPALSEIVSSIERARLVVSDVEVLSLHYALTLKAWRERFLARRDEALALCDERFCRMWEFYLASAEVAFRCEALVVFQLQLTASPNRAPLTRNYIAETERDLMPAAAAKPAADHSVDARSRPRPPCSAEAAAATRTPAAAM